MCPVINAASSGGSRFIVTSGLVETGNRCLLIGVAAHELAHDTLGHVQSARAARTGINTAANLVGAFYIRRDALDFLTRLQGEGAAAG